MKDERFTGLPEQVPPTGAPDLSGSLGGGMRPARVALLGCGVVLFLLGIATVIFLLKADDFVGWVFGSLEESIVERLPPDLPDADRRRLEAAFDGAVERMTGDEADPEALRRLQRQLSSIVRETGDERPLTHAEVAEITAAFEAVAESAEADGPDR